MSLQAKTILNLIAGAVAGLLAWALTDLTGWFPGLHQERVVYPSDPQILLYGAVFGLMLGLLLGIVEAMSLDSQCQMWMSLLLGGVVGFFGGAIGAYFGQFVWGLLTKDIDPYNVTPQTFFPILLARGFGYSIIGLVVGAAQGLSRRSVIIARQGAFGGLVGGFLGGVCFQVTAALLNGSPLSRLAALAATGALVGFFVGLVQNLFKQAWIRVVLGRNEGKEYLLAKPITTIGRSELSDIGLYGDPQIAPTHAVIEAIPAQKRHRLRHVADAPGQGRGGPYPPTLVNGQPVTAEQWLADGDTVQLGKRTLLFQEKATRGARPINPPAPPAGAQHTAPLPPASSVGTVTRYVGQELTEALPPATVRAAPLTASPAEATVLLPQTVAQGGGGAGTRLVCTAGPYAGQSFPLSHAALTLGRASDCDIALVADTLISRRQAEVSYADGRHQLRDIGSANGTFVNGQRADGVRPLSAGDLIQMGDTALRYE